MDVVVIGAGSIGLALAATLGSTGARVRIIARSDESASSIRREGISRTGLFGDALLDPSRFEVETELESLTGTSPDFVLVCTKTTDSPALARALAPVWPSFTSRPEVVLFQNGWGNSEIFAEHLPSEKIFCAGVLIGFRRTDLHSSQVTVHAKSIQMGSLFGADPHALRTLAARITQGGVPCEVTDHIGRELWAKMLYNCALNPLGAVLRVPYGALADSPHSRSIMDEVVREVFAVMHAAGHATFWDSATDYLDAFYREILPPTRAHESSMLQDLRAGRATEIDALSGARVASASDTGIATPANAALATLIRAQGSGANSSADGAGVS